MFYRYTYRLKWPPEYHTRLEIFELIIYVFSGHLRHGLQGQVEAHGQPRGPQRNPAGTRGRRTVYGHQRGLPAQGS